MDLLLDVNIVLDICQPRHPFADSVHLALSKCHREGGRMWLYAGAVQTMLYLLANGLLDDARRAGTELSRGEALRRSRRLLQVFSSDKHWLSALAGEGDVFADDDPEDEQLVRALDRFKEGGIRLLTRDDRLLGSCTTAISCADYLVLAPRTESLEFIDLATQQALIRPRLERQVHRVLHHGQYIMGPEVIELESRLAATVGVKHCVTTSSGTDALLIALMALGIKRDDEVITTPFSFFATVEVILLLGAVPVFVDIDPRTYNLDPNKLEVAITPRTRAIVPVSLYGQCADFDPINAIAARYKLPVIEDAAQSFGATYKGRPSCSLTMIACTSFYPAKPLGAYGDGGACFTDDDEIAARLSRLRDHGQSGRYRHTEVGINGRLDTLQAAVLLAKLDIFADEVLARQRAAERYDALIRSLLSDIAPPYLEPWCASVYAQYTLNVENRAELQNMLQSKGIPTAIHYPTPLHSQPALGLLTTTSGSFAQAETAAARVISVPLHPYLEEATQIAIIRAIATAYAGKR